MKKAPNEEAKLTAVQLRSDIYKCLEDAIENEWDRLEERLLGALVLTQHLQKIEAGYRR